MFLFLLFAVAFAIVYLTAGNMLLSRGLNYARAHALLDPQFFHMVITDRSMSMLLPKLLFVALWPVFMLAIMLTLVARRILSVGQPRATAF